MAREVTRVEDAIAAVDRVLAGAEDGGRQALDRLAVLITNRVKRLLSEPGRGRWYTRRGVPHRASAPGQPPAVDTGRLRQSYTLQSGEDRRGPFVDIGTNIAYAPWLEFGTRKLAPRPHLRRAVREVLDEEADIIRRGVVAGEQRSL